VEEWLLLVVTLEYPSAVIIAIFSMEAQATIHRLTMDQRARNWTINVEAQSTAA